MNEEQWNQVKDPLPPERKLPGQKQPGNAQYNGMLAEYGYSLWDLSELFVLINFCLCACVICIHF